ncbi:MAG: NADPH-dependent assimilatory sulfite reductase hemoprotein subunit [Opitutales bacterium]
MGSQTEKLHKNEGLKEQSAYLRGTILEGLANQAHGDISADDQQLTKFHGIYQQDDRDVRSERRKQKLDKAYSFMVRVRVPGGVCSPEQWLQMDAIADNFGGGRLKLTTRQAFQLHGVIKSNLKQTIRDINQACMDTIAACGDVNRNVMCNVNPYESAVHAETLAVADQINAHLTPRTGAYAEIWLDGEKVETSEALKTPTQPLNAATGDEMEPIYGKTYLPRKFKTVVAIPPYNDVDVFAHDLGYIAIVEDGKLAGFNVTVGGGMGMTHGNKATFPRTADVAGFIAPEDAVRVAEAVVTTQRDFGNREDRKNARLKYTIERMGIEAFKAEVEKRSGVSFEPARPFEFTSQSDRYGWTEGADGRFHCQLFIQNGVVLNNGVGRVKDGLREIAKIHDGDFRLTGNQNLLIGRVSSENKPKIEALLAEYGLDSWRKISGLRRNAMACVALPTCGLALAESQRYLPDLVAKIEDILGEHGLTNEDIVIRMTGCPNGCARPYLAEIGLVGKAPGKYNLYLGAAFDGSRLNKLYKESLKENEILAELRQIIGRYAQERTTGEHFGDFCIRSGFVAPVNAAASDWWA